MISLLRRFFEVFFSFLGVITMFLFGLMTYLFWLLQPAFYFPKPTGPYAVGTKTYHWVDTKRQEVPRNDRAHPCRELMVKFGILPNYRQNSLLPVPQT